MHLYLQCSNLKLGILNEWFLDKDEVIQKFRNRALDCECEGNLWFSSCGKNNEFGIDCMIAALENHQIADWLTELKEIKGL